MAQGIHSMANGILNRLSGLDLLETNTGINEIKKEIEKTKEEKQLKNSIR
jgi:hypothetical protein